jgi:hypothetical protein
LLGARPQTPWVGCAEAFCEAEQTLFASFSGKKRKPLNAVSLGARPQTPCVGFAEGWVDKPSAKQNEHFLLLFLEKEEYH